MKQFKEIFPMEMQGNLIEKVGKDWMLIAAESAGKTNMMTASWGGFGFIWNKPVATVVLRPQRYTWELVSAADTFSLTFFAEEYRPQLRFCGANSGRHVNKIEETGFTVLHDGGAPYFEQAKLAVICKKLYVQQLKKECFTDASIPAAHYPEEDFHYAVVGEIVKVLQEA